MVVVMLAASFTAGLGWLLPVSADVAPYHAVHVGGERRFMPAHSVSCGSAPFPRYDGNTRASSSCRGALTDRRTIVIAASLVLGTAAGATSYVRRLEFAPLAAPTAR